SRLVRDTSTKSANETEIILRVPDIFETPLLSGWLAVASGITQNNACRVRTFPKYNYPSNIWMGRLSKQKNEKSCNPTRWVRAGDQDWTKGGLDGRIPKAEALNALCWQNSSVG